MKLICTAFFLALMVVSCSRVPEETMDGRGTFYCQVNGEDYEPYCKRRGIFINWSSGCNELNSIYSRWRDRMTISVNREFEDENDQRQMDVLTFQICNVFTDPFIDCINFDTEYYGTTYWHCDDFYLEDPNDFTLNITKIDTVARIFSCTFSATYKAEKMFCDFDSLVITEGIVDVSFQMRN